VSAPPDHTYARLERPLLPVAGSPARHFVLSSIRALEAALFLRAVEGMLGDSTDRDAFVFVHGFNESFASAAYRTAQLAIDLEFQGVAAFYSWPSMASPLSYIADGTTIERSIDFLAEFLLLVAAKTSVSKIHVIAHSMGNRGLTRALPEALKGLPPGRQGVFHEVVLAAPDVDAEVFRNQIVPAMCPRVRRTTLYASSRDRALRLSRFLHRFPRLGLTTDGIFVHPSVETIDASETDLSLIGTRHSVFSQVPAVVSDLKLAVDGQPPPKRPRLQPRTADGKAYWWFKK
jgi:esterase/lipase superfamily enzyme